MTKHLLYVSNSGTSTLQTSGKCLSKIVIDDGLDLATSGLVD